MGLRFYRCHGQLSRTCVPNLSCDYFNQSCLAKNKNSFSCYFASLRQNRHSTKMYVVHRNALSESFRIRIVWFQPKQDSDRTRILFFKNRIGSDSENPLSDHLWLGPEMSIGLDLDWTGSGYDQFVAEKPFFVHFLDLVPKVLNLLDYSWTRTELQKIQDWTRTAKYDSPLISDLD